MPPLHAAVLTPSQKLAAEARRERERKIAARADPDPPHASAPAPARPASGSRPAAPAPPPAEPPPRIRPKLRTWFHIVAEIKPVFAGNVTIEAIQSAVERHCQVELRDLTSTSRAVGITRARQIAMFLAKELTASSLTAIGRQFGDRDRATVLHAIRKIGALRRRDSGLAQDLDAIRRAIKATGG